MALASQDGHPPRAGQATPSSFRSVLTRPADSTLMRHTSNRAESSKVVNYARCSELRCLSVTPRSRRRPGTSRNGARRARSSYAPTSCSTANPPAIASRSAAAARRRTSPTATAATTPPAPSHQASPRRAGSPGSPGARGIDRAASFQIRRTRRRAASHRRRSPLLLGLMVRIESQGSSAENGGRAVPSKV
jgi:hypothetical protein